MLLRLIHAEHRILSSVWVYDLFHTRNCPRRLAERSFSFSRVPLDVKPVASKAAKSPLQLIDQFTYYYSFCLSKDIIIFVIIGFCLFSISLFTSCTKFLALLSLIFLFAWSFSYLSVYLFTIYSYLFLASEIRHSFFFCLFWGDRIILQYFK